MNALFRNIKNEDLDKLLSKSELGFRSLVENAFVGIAISDLKGGLKYVNKALADLTGYSVQELQNQPFKNFIHPDDRGRVMRLFLRIILLRREPRHLEFRLLRKDGRVLTLWSKPSRFTVNGKTIGFQAVVMDITELKEMEKQLKETNRKLQLLLETAMEGITIADPNDNLIFSNKAFAEMLGYKENELKGINLRKLANEEDYRKIRKETEERKKGKISRYELSLKRKDGKTCYVQVSASPLWNEDGSYAGALAIIMDITERKRIEEELRESEDRLRCLLEYAPEAIYTNDLNGNFVDGNKQAEALTGYKKEELIGKNMLEVGLLPEKYAQKAVELLQKNMKGEKTGPDELELIRKDGEKIVVEISTFPAKRKGKIEVIGIARDITDKKRIEEALKRSEKQYRTLFENANDNLVLLDNSGRIIDINNKATQTFGGSKEELLGRHFTEVSVFSQEDLPKLLDIFARLLDGKEEHISIAIKNKKGQELYLECSSSIIRTEDKIVGILVIARDVTERTQMQKKLEEYSQQLEALVEKRTAQLKATQEQLVKSERLAAIGQVAAMVGHDLRNPLTSIKGATYYLKTTLRSGMNKKTKEMLALIENSIEYSNKIIADLLEYSREIKLELTQTTPKRIITETLSFVKVPNNVQIINSSEDYPKTKMDVDKMKRAFANLIKNAVDAMPDGGKLTISSRQSNGTVEFIFVDTGIGMAKENMEKIWTPFFTTKSRGIGLGLPICKRIIEAHGGKIHVESIVGEGTTFTVIMPIEPKTKEEGGEKIWVDTPKSLLSTTTKT